MNRETDKSDHISATREWDNFVRYEKHLEGTRSLVFSMIFLQNFSCSISHPFSSPLFSAWSCLTFWKWWKYRCRHYWMGLTMSGHNWCKHLPSSNSWSDRVQKPASMAYFLVKLRQSRSVFKLPSYSNSGLLSWKEKTTNVKGIVTKTT